ncbi:MAG TPA: hypothetical protein VJK03_01345 [Candidatus Nanoarchaeia archaeon]|nr:hypothetical protein [Candidatus Nanoarchaeia archaeon]
MFWNKKEEKGLPDLPPSKSAPVAASPPIENEDEEESERHGLPSFPDSPMQKGFSQAAIKDAITNDAVGEEIISAPPKESSFKAVEMEEWSAQQEIPSLAMQTPLQPKKEMDMPQPRPVKSDVFVKIDKFYSARKALEAAGIKLDEIDELLRKIRETKLREEQELSSWEKDMAIIKARLKDVTSTIFEKTE